MNTNHPNDPKPNDRRRADALRVGLVLAGLYATLATLVLGREVPLVLAAESRQLQGSVAGIFSWLVTLPTSLLLVRLGAIGLPLPTGGWWLALAAFLQTGLLFWVGYGTQRLFVR